MSATVDNMPVAFAFDPPARLSVVELVRAVARDEIDRATPPEARTLCMRDPSIRARYKRWIRDVEIELTKAMNNINRPEAP